MQIQTEYFGTTDDGRAVQRHTLWQGEMTLRVLDYGATIQSLLVPGRAGRAVDVVLGYDTLAEYQAGTEYLGACIGRCANRIGRGTFTLNGVRYQLACNDAGNHLHGGLRGFDTKCWTPRMLEDGICYSCTAPDGEEGYPGTLTAEVSYRLPDAQTLLVEYTARTDRDTLYNPTNHSYFNLDGQGDISGHTLWLDADAFGENDASCLPTGRLLPVAGTAFDFRSPARLGERLSMQAEQLVRCGGFDHAYRLNGGVAARLHSPHSGIAMEVCTDRPYLQLYTANTLPVCPGKRGDVYRPYCAVCFETQVFPNALAYAGFETPILRAGAQFVSQTSFRFSVR